MSNHKEEKLVKKYTLLVLALFLFLMAFSLQAENENEEISLYQEMKDTNLWCYAQRTCWSRILRSADPCNTWSRPSWQDGPGAIQTPQLQGGNASHNLTPAEIVYYSVRENSSSELGFVVNPVLILTYLENASLLTQGLYCGDFEFRLLKSVGYAKDITKYNGFYPQIVASTYQWRLYQERELPFEDAQKLYPFLSMRSFKEVYAKNVRIMNKIAKTNFSEYPFSQGYYQDFFDFVGIGDIQKFFEVNNSPLKNKNLFKRLPLRGSEVDYSNMNEYCE